MRLTWLIVAFFIGVVRGDEDEPVTPPPFKPPSKPEGNVNLAESFSNEGDVWRVWVKSQVKKDGGVEKYDGEATAEF